MEAKHTHDWTIPENDIIHVPDELDPMINKVGMQIRFHTISNKGEIETICDIVRISELFFYKHYEVEKLKESNAELLEALEKLDKSIEAYLSFECPSTFMEVIENKVKANYLIQKAKGE